jgi:DNA-binding NarL/FixJ family response regulator
MISIALVDDHVLLRNGLATLVKLIGFDVLFEADHGDECIKQITAGNKPDVILMDVNMPVKDGYETTLWLKQNYPEIKVMALTMIDDENAIIRMLKNGARGYLLKDTNPVELKTAICDVVKKGFYYSELVSGRLVHSLTGDDQGHNTSLPPGHLSEKEIQFLKLVCTEMVYKEIAGEMNVSPRTVDSYRDNLFSKLNIKTRTGLAVYAIKHGIVKL